MDDLHFMERLGRVAANEVELALGLYRDPKLVSFVLQRDAPSDAQRVAISLRDPIEGPFIVVQKNGHFVTCLGEGMRTGLPVITRARLEQHRGRHGDLQQRLRFLESADDLTIVRMWKLINDRAHRVPREVMTTLTMVAPLLGSVVRDKLHEVGLALHETLGECRRLASRIGRWSAHDEATVEALWKNMWWLSHLLMLDYSRPRDALVERQAAQFATHPTPLFRAFSAALAIPFRPVQARVAWAFSRVGSSLVETAVAFHKSTQITDPRNASALGLTAIALAHPTTRADVLSALRPETPETADSLTVGRLLRGVLEEDELEATTRQWLLRVGRVIEKLPDLTPEECVQAAREPSALRHVQLGGCYAANTFCEAFGTVRQVNDLGRLMPWVVRVEADELYWSEVDLNRFEKPFEPHHAQDLVRALGGVNIFTAKHIQQAQPKTTAAKPGRNDPCPCGSGKKHKKCCGA